MKSLFGKSLAVLAIASLAVTSGPTISAVDAAGAKSRKAAKSYKPSPQVRGSSQRVGGYSYTYQDSIIDFRDRSVFLDSSIEKNAGPFDSGFFFDSGVERQNDSPYLN